MLLKWKVSLSKGVNLKNKILSMILSWNGADDTIECVKSLLNSESPSDCTHNMLLFDNNSNASALNEIIKYLEGSFKHLNRELVNFNGKTECVEVYEFSNKLLYLYMNDENIGFAKACNKGVNLSQLLGYSHSILLNNDTIVENDAVDKLWQGFKESNFDIVIPQIRYWNRKDIIWNCGGRVNKLGRVNYYYGGKSVREVSIGGNFQVDFATGCCMLFSNDFFLKIGGFTEKYFFGEEDVELSFRLRKLNKLSGCVSSSIIYHKVGASIQGNLQTLSRKAYIHYLNRLLNLKDQMPIILWHCVKNAMFIGISFTLFNKYKLGFYEIFNFILALNVDSNNRINVDKLFFHTIMKKGVKDRYE